MIDTNKEKLKEYFRQYYINNRDKIIEKSKTRYEAQKDKWTAEKREFYKVNRERLLEDKRLYGKTARCRWFDYIKKAQKRNLCFELSLEQFAEITSKKCCICNEFSINQEHCGVDRLDNNIGYVYSNCVSMCRKHNNLKGAMLIDDMRKIIQIYDERNK